ncbi:hypothetical protein [Azospirillum sp. B510]|uniref:hypothetical protein n=1 Tax=Alphaproteobacteria TaxID=28211 RepID=UPI00034D5E2C|nr:MULTISPECIES: hypothetical protein [Alphaproteobacteria]
MTLSDITRRIATRHGLRWGFVSDRERQATPHTVDQIGLSFDAMGHPFARAHGARVGWCRKFIDAEWHVEPLQRVRGEDVGRRFRFEREEDAQHFRRRFPLLAVLDATPAACR